MNRLSVEGDHCGCYCYRCGEHACSGLEGIIEEMRALSGGWSPARYLWISSCRVLV